MQNATCKKIFLHVAFCIFNSTMMKLIVSSRIADKVEPRLAEMAPDCVVIRIDQDGTPEGDLSDAEVFLRWFGSSALLRRIIHAAPRLRWIHTSSAGVDHVLI